MQKVWKIFEYGYLVVAIIFIVEAILKWSESREKAYLMLLFSVIAMFRKRFRKKIENRNK